MKVNVDKCGVMHIRRNGVKRTLFSVEKRLRWWKAITIWDMHEHMDCI